MGCNYLFVEYNSSGKKTILKQITVQLIPNITLLPFVGLTVIWFVVLF
ncbi:hypothetical protein M23134_07060 [Microscilla marina ATCC 23134]|uniref:Uncharacterized protein n=1 Tax=Microscilla marina ATCC 23134 TaxID=313606 RepID=A1ZT75_MICM2|nr:hypothetical protein M23134_07060 [Microscilla marina ATCC 23134]